MHDADVTFIEARIIFKGLLMGFTTAITIIIFTGSIGRPLGLASQCFVSRCLRPGGTRTKHLSCRFPKDSNTKSNPRIRLLSALDRCYRFATGSRPGIAIKINRLILLGFSGSGGPLHRETHSRGSAVFLPTGSLVLLPVSSLVTTS